MLLTACYSNCLQAQDVTAFKEQANKYVKYVDSINELDHQNKDFTTSIADGVIKIDDNIVGGFGIYTLANAKYDTAFRIEYSGGIDITVKKTYYYKYNKLIFARLMLKDTREIIYQREEVFNNDIILCTSTKKDKKANRYISETNISLFDDGLHFLEDFKKESNR